MHWVRESGHRRASQQVLDMPTRKQTPALGVPVPLMPQSLRRPHSASAIFLDQGLVPIQPSPAQPSHPHVSQQPLQAPESRHLLWPLSLVVRAGSSLRGGCTEARRGGWLAGDLLRPLRVSILLHAPKGALVGSCPRNTAKSGRAPDRRGPACVFGGGSLPCCCLPALIRGSRGGHELWGHLLGLCRSQVPSPLHQGV